MRLFAHNPFEGYGVLSGGLMEGIVFRCIRWIIKCYQQLQVFFAHKTLSFLCVLGVFSASSAFKTDLTAEDAEIRREFSLSLNASGSFRSRCNRGPAEPVFETNLAEQRPSARNK